MAPASMTTTKDLLTALGITRVIWIDDCFEGGRDNIRERIRRDPELLSDLGLPWIALALEAHQDEDEDLFDRRLTEALGEASDDDLGILNREIRRKAARVEGEESSVQSPDDDLPVRTIEAACRMLNVSEQDRKGFEDGRRLIDAVAKENADGVAYVVDLQNAFVPTGSGASAGIDIIREIYARQGFEMVFVLTHEAAIDTEAAKEEVFVAELGENMDRYPFPCIISKERIASDSEEDLAKGLQVALKRSALRRETFRVACSAERHAAEAVRKARAEMCRIPPEELDRFFVQRAVAEGASELHMIERIITAQISRNLRRMFVSDEDVKSSLARMRMLREIELLRPATDRHEVIDRFRQDEIWEEGEFLRSSHAPLALGDVFETINGAPSRMFILLGQPCDLMLRGDGKRSAHTAELIRFKPTPNTTASCNQGEARKSPRTLDLPIGNRGTPLRFDFRESASASLDLLELATFNMFGEVRISSAQKEAAALLKGQRIKFVKAKKLLDGTDGVGETGSEILEKKKLRYALTFKAESPFNTLCVPVRSECDGITMLQWNLRRTRRLRAPYVDMLVDRQMAILNRRALDADYLPEAVPEQSPDEASRE